MKKLLVILSMVILIACSPKVITKTVVEHKTDTLVELRIIHDSVKYEVPFIKEVNMTKDSTSHIENEYASSDASIEDGILHHSLETKPHTIYVPYETIVRDTVIKEVFKEQKQDTIIEKSSWWDRTKNSINSMFFGMVLCFILGIILYILKKFNKI